MCGRLCCACNHMTLSYACTYKEGEKFKTVNWFPEDSYKSYTENYNMAPYSMTPVLLYKKQLTKKSKDIELILTSMKWTALSDSHISTINARSENMYRSPLYCSAIKSRRCIVLSEGFYEWKNNKPYFFHLPQPAHIKINDPKTWIGSWSESNGWSGVKLLPLAGIYNIISNTEQGTEFGYSIVTMEARDGVEEIHKRMPLILDTSEKMKTWMDEGYNEQVVNSIKAIPVKILKYRVSELIVNASKNNVVKCIFPYSEKKLMDPNKDYTSLLAGTSQAGTSQAGTSRQGKPTANKSTQCDLVYFGKPNEVLPREEIHRIKERASESFLSTKDENEAGSSTGYGSTFKPEMKNESGLENSSSECTPKTEDDSCVTSTFNEHGEAPAVVSLTASELIHDIDNAIKREPTDEDKGESSKKRRTN